MKQIKTMWCEIINAPHAEVWTQLTVTKSLFSDELYNELLGRLDDHRWIGLWDEYGLPIDEKAVEQIHFGMKKED